MNTYIVLRMNTYIKNDVIKMTRVFAVFVWRLSSAT